MLLSVRIIKSIERIGLFHRIVEVDGYVPSSEAELPQWSSIPGSNVI